MIFKNELSKEELDRLFQDDDYCLAFLAKVKWENGFECKKCGNLNSCSGKSPYSRRCTKCKTEESASAHTLFHNCKFPMHKAFYIAWQVCKGESSTSSYEFARQLSLRQMTCWKFKTKIQHALDDISGMSKVEKMDMAELLAGK